MRAPFEGYVPEEHNAVFKASPSYAAHKKRLHLLVHHHYNGELEKQIQRYEEQAKIYLHRQAHTKAKYLSERIVSLTGKSLELTMGMRGIAQPYPIIEDIMPYDLQAVARAECAETPQGKMKTHIECPDIFGWAHSHGLLRSSFSVQDCHRMSKDAHKGVTIRFDLLDDDEESLYGDVCVYPCLLYYADETLAPRSRIVISYRRFDDQPREVIRFIDNPSIEFFGEAVESDTEAWDRLLLERVWVMEEGAQLQAKQSSYFDVRNGSFVQGKQLKEIVDSSSQLWFPWWA